jgi:hypothetical protein
LKVNADALCPGRQFYIYLPVIAEKAPAQGIEAVSFCPAADGFRDRREFAELCGILGKAGKFPGKRYKRKARFAVFTPQMRPNSE